MKPTTIDLITETPETGEFALILVEDGPWPESDADWNECLSRIQSRIYGAVDIAIDGHLAAKYPDSKGRAVRVQVDSPNGLPSALAKLVAKMKVHFEADGEYKNAITQSPFIQGLRITTGHDMGCFEN
jgi:hypothetical protein